MSKPPGSAGAGLLRFGFWIPVAVLVGVEVYASRFDGWGAWATGPLFLLPLGLSLGIVPLGGRVLADELRSRRLQAMTVARVLVGIAPLAWLLVRRHVV